MRMGVGAGGGAGGLKHRRSISQQQEGGGGGPGGWGRLASKPEATGNQSPPTNFVAAILYLTAKRPQTPFGR